MRWSITGTTTSAVQPCWAVSDSVASSSNLRLSTIVDERPMPSVKCAKPQAWNSGAAIIVFSRAFSGIRESSAATGSSDFGWLREAPFGVPVVPEVRMIALPGLLGRDDAGGVAALDQRLERRVLGLALRLAPGDVALAPVAGVGEHLARTPRRR